VAWPLLFPAMRPLLALLWLLVASAKALAGGSSPVLTLTSADTFASASGVIAVDVRGSFNFEDVVEGVFPSGLVVHQGTHFVRFDQAGAVVEGTDAALADGLGAADVAGLVGLGAAVPAPAALSQLRADRVTAVLPADFSAGPASVVLYALYAGQGFVSNTLTVTLP
jgi:hypothetical protein